MLAAFIHPNHIVCLCSWGFTRLPPTCNSTGSLGIGILKLQLKHIGLASCFWFFAYTKILFGL
ncbi:hypothetical protein CGT96_10100 [Vibrio metoecus]|nr:hypothetical protein CGT97_06360 [Vibrio metoecus]PAR42987.1 hypothetical protein CGT96_10100 [Vibrio metoecus]